MSDLHSLLRRDSNFEQTDKELAKIPLHEAISMLEQLALESERKYRMRALDWMRSLSPERGEALAIRFLDDPDGNVRHLACEIVGDSSNPRKLPLLTKLLKSDPDDDVRIWAAFWLGVARDRSVIPILKSAADQDSATDYEGRTMRDVATRAIEKILARETTEGNKAVDAEDDRPTQS